MQLTRHTLMTALVATALLAPTADAMPARDLGHRAEIASHAKDVSCDSQPALLAAAGGSRRGPLAV